MPWSLLHALNAAERFDTLIRIEAVALGERVPVLRAGNVQDRDFHVAVVGARRSAAGTSVTSATR